MGSLVRAIVSNRRRKQKATHAGNNEVPQGPRLQGALCLVRGYTMQVFRRKTAKQKQHPHECCFYLERKTRLELATPTLARLCSTYVTGLFPIGIAKVTIFFNSPNFLFARRFAVLSLRGVMLNYGLELAQEPYIVLKIESQILYLPFEHCDTLDTHAEGKA